MLNAPNSPLLNIFERLGALSEDEGGLIEIKPFRDWKGSGWQNKILKMRLLNVGEMLEVYDYCEKYQGNAKDQAYYIEILIRSLYSLDGQMLAPSEEVEKYNQDYKTKLSRIEYLRLWLNNIEQVVVIRLHSVYEQLQLKQLRLVNGQYLCEDTGQVVNDFPPSARRIKYAIGEIVTDVKDETAYDFNEPKIETSFTPPLETKVVAEFDYYCNCGQGFESIEEFTAHRENCNESAAISTS